MMFWEDIKRCFLRKRKRKITKIERKLGKKTEKAAAKD
jgi:hypothetical protein